MEQKGLLKRAMILIVCAISLGVNSEEQCIYGTDGLCMEKCPPDTVSYTASCEEEVMSQRTCRAPVARSIGRDICDYSRCDCAGGRVWDEAVEKCVPLSLCSDQSAIKSDRF